MKNNQSLNSYKQCTICQRLIPLSYTLDICPHCVDNTLFNDVKEFIRNNDVNEYQVAEYFHIPLRKIKTWIKEGRIEYKENDGRPATFGRIHCQRCGTPVSFGTLCNNCLKLINKNVIGHNVKRNDDSSKMRFFDTEDEQ